MALTTCSSCQAEVPDGALHCPACGTAVVVPAAAAAAPAPDPMMGSAPPTFAAAPAAAGAGATQFKFDLKRLTQADLIAGVAFLVIFIALLLPWYTANACASADGVNYCASGSVNGLWHGYMYLPFLVAIVAFIYLLARASLVEMPVKLPIEDKLALTVAGAICLLFVVISLIDTPDGAGFGPGLWLGLIASIAALAPTAWPMIQARQSGGKSAS